MSSKKRQGSQLDGPPSKKPKKVETEEPVQRGRVHKPAVSAIMSSNLTKISLENWSSGNIKPFDAKLVERIYKEELLDASTRLGNVILLELSSYLENYLWPNYEGNASMFHTLSTTMMINEKFRENAENPWDSIEKNSTHFPQLIDALVQLYRSDISLSEKSIIVLFFINMFVSQATPLIAKQSDQFVSLLSWSVLSQSLRDEIFEKNPKLGKYWRAYQKKQDNYKHTTFLSEVMDEFGQVISEPELDLEGIQYCERVLELMIDLCSQSKTRRFFRTILTYKNMSVIAARSPVINTEEGLTLRQQAAVLKFYEHANVDDLYGNALTEEEITQKHYDLVTRLQSRAYKAVPELRSFALASVGSVDSRSQLAKYLSTVKLSTLRSLLADMNIPVSSDANQDFVLDALANTYERHQDILDMVNDNSVYPDEKLLWESNIIPGSDYNGERSLTLPKLNLQFLSLHDLLLRHFTLYKLEAAYSIRDDIEDAISRMNPRKNIAGGTSFRSWARMALPISGIHIRNVHKPEVGELKPAAVIAEVMLTLPNKKDVAGEWDDLKAHDVLFLVTVQSKLSDSSADTDEPEDFLDVYKVVHLRGAEILEIIDEQGTSLTGFDKQMKATGSRRIVKVSLDTAQYKKDMESEKEGTDNVYNTFNLVVRRKSKENNFKSVLEATRMIMNSKSAVPEWLSTILVGHSDPKACTRIQPPTTIDFVDTFVDAQHIRDVFAGKKIDFKPAQGENAIFNKLSITDTSVTVESYTAKHVSLRNTVRFTPTQVQAIESAMCHGLTLVVGPPGTGKTDVAVQVASNWLHAYPDQRILIVTHSNNALNQIFEKIIKLNVDEKYLLRLGHGSEMLETSKDFSKAGRVNHMLQLRLDLLEEVYRLGYTLGLGQDIAFSCETAESFYKHQIVARWEHFLASVGSDQSDDAVKNRFPFTDYCLQKWNKTELFDGDDDLEAAKDYMAQINQLFHDLQMCRPFEILRGAKGRGNYILTHQARVIAMTCTHASLRRKELVNLKFSFHNIIMEEAAQVLEIDALIPILLQEKEEDAKASKLKRVVLIGDHNQLPPVIKNSAFQKFAHMDQSLFTRFIRLGVPAITLDAQGRCRSTMASLFNWKYPNLRTLPSAEQKPEFKLANAGFGYDFQLIDVPDYMGMGEMEPTPYYYQNLGEAEYMVATYMYMRMLHYPAEKITLLTTYKGQKALIKDILAQKCAWDPRFGMPRVSTVDRYQGQQNDYVLLSLVRTKTVGYLRDVRRLTVAMSRARLGLYVFGRAALYRDCYELAPTFSVLLKRPTRLVLAKNEDYGVQRSVEDVPEDGVQVIDTMHMIRIAQPTYETVTME